MARRLTHRQIEDRLIESLKRDRAVPSNLRVEGRPDDMTIIVSPSNDSVGLAMAVMARTGETDACAVMDRVMEGI